MNKNVTINLIKKIKTSDCIEASLILKDRRFAFSCYNNIYIYDLHNYKCDMIIKGHITEVIHIIQLSNGKLVTLSDILKIFRISKNQYWCEFTFYPENDNDITCLVQLSNNRMVSSCSEPYLTFWNSNPPYNIIKKVKISDNDDINFDGLYKMKNKKDTLLCYQYTCFVLFFYDYKRCQIYFHISEASVTDIDGILETFNRKLLISDEECKVIVIDIKTLNIEKTYSWKGEISGTFKCFYELKRNIIVCGGVYGELYLLDLNNDKVKSIKTSKEDHEIKKLVYIGKNTLINQKLEENYFEIQKINV